MCFQLPDDSVYSFRTDLVVGQVRLDTEAFEEFPGAADGFVDALRSGAAWGGFAYKFALTPEDWAVADRHWSVA